jgi:hypothetical protein
VNPIPAHQSSLDAIHKELAADCRSDTQLSLLKHKDKIDASATARQDQAQRDKLALGMVAQLKTAVLKAGMSANNTDSSMNGLEAIEEHLGARQELRDKLKSSINDALVRINYLWNRQCCPKSCGDHGSCDHSTGKCSCEEGFVGDTCAVACPVHEDNVCNLHGKCTATGTCECEKDFRGSKCEIACPRSTSNSLVCHGKGTCDASGKCSCTTGSTGAACDECAKGYWKNKDGVCQECPNGAGAPCNNQGTCGANGKCSCKPGFAGSACQISCPKNGAGAICSGVGLCNANSGTCECPPTHRGQACETSCPTHGGSVCNGHGCSASGKCTCAEGFHGASCQIECPKANGKHCNAKGTCLASGKCSCNSGWSGASCDKPCPIKNGRVCNGRGTCSNGACVCQKAFRGSDCGVSCPRDHRGNVCAAHGTCSSAGKCSCAAGYVGSSCQRMCPRDAAGLVCGNKGTCSDSLRGAQCVCKAPYTGKSCSQATYGWFTVPSLQHGRWTRLARQCPGGASTPCSGHGSCLSNGRCRCNGGHHGHDCSIRCSYHEQCGWTGCGRGCARGHYTRSSHRCGWGWRNRKSYCCRRVRRCYRVSRRPPQRCSWTGCSFGGCPSGKVLTRTQNCGWRHMWANKELCCHR